MKKENYSSVKVFGLEGLHENTNIKFTDTGITLSVGLCVEEKISKVLHFNQLLTGFTGKVYKSEQRFMYRHYCKIESKNISNSNIESAQKDLLKLLQIDINRAKGIYYSTLSNSIKLCV